jgi:Flp pilus assembly protein TadD/beta-lactamase regulating signal transducer with metallopeptidase domain
MNALGIALAWCIVQVTLLSLLAAGIYLLVRRIRPAAAGPVVLTSLVAIMVLSLMAFSPWPRWNLWKLFQSAEESPIASGASIGDLGEGDRSLPGADRLEPEPAENAEIAPSPSKLNPFLQTVEGLFQPPVTESASGWRLPEVIAISLFAAMGLGIAWLLLGVFAVRRQRIRSRPIDDGRLLELIDVLCAELRCLRPVEVRQSDELVTAATIGWRKPVLLLPADWTNWTLEQLRAVLAHEIAHARSHDFLALLCGQLGLMLHFYHPVVHWLMNRLRLEQELSADAAAANIMGGQRQYLTTIAELALSRQDRPLMWPARTFLPTRNTFLRRIAMLRDSQLHFERLSPLARMLTVGVIVVGGSLVAGLRGSAPVSAADASEAALPVKEMPTTPSEDAAANNAETKVPATDNLLSNPSAEKGEEFADDWLQGPAIEGVKYSWDKNTASDGKASLCIEKTVNRYFPIAGWSQIVERKGEAPYLEVSAQVKTKKMYKAVLDVIFLDQNDERLSHEWAAYIGDKTGKSSPANHDWKKYSGIVKIPAGTAKITVELQDYGPGKVWFDDIRAKFVQSKDKTPATSSRKIADDSSADSAKNQDKAHRLALLSQGWQLFQSGESEKAEKKFQEYIDSDPKNPNAWNGLGWAKFHSGKSQEAIEAFREVLKLEPNYPAALNGLGQIFFFQKNYDQAESYLLKAAPQAPAAWYGLTKLCLLQGKFEEAEKWAQKVVDSNEADEVAPLLLQAAKDKSLSDDLRSIIEPQKKVAQEIAANEPDKVASTGNAKILSYVSETAEDRVSFADSGYAVLFERPSDMKSVRAVRLFGSRYGTPRPPAEKFHIYLLDENKKVLEHILVPYSKVQRSAMKWFTFEFPAIQVPEKFYVAFWFDAESTKGVYVGKDRNIAESHSYAGLPDTGYEKVEELYDWMIRAEVSDEAGKTPSYPKVKTYGEEDEGIAEISRTRIWNDVSGSFNLEAELVKLEDGNVTLKKTNGKTITIALDKLSQEDREFVAKQSDAK